VDIDPAELSGLERYKLLIGGILPRPIAVVSTLDAQGRPNLAPFSFFNGVGGHPMTLMFCPANNGDGSEKDSLRNASATGEFVVNVAPDSMIERIAATAEGLPHGESEFDFAGLDAVSSKAVAPARVGGSPISYECRTRQILRLAEGEPGGANMVIGDVVHVYVDDAVIDDRFRIDPAAIDLVGRLGGFGYARTRDRFDLRAGKAALDEGRQER
jgi:flavin reductase (DIM6/NTAB) family NADH-FMN oxidoreductase RutF